jgi:hypothetical protein
MRRKDAFRKVRTICQRLDQADTTYFRPQRLYLYGSLLTDKPNPTDIDLVLVYQRTPAYIQYLNASGAVLQEIREAPGSYYGRFLADLRRGMKMIRLEPATDTLANWIHQDLLILDEELRLIWQPGLRRWSVSRHHRAPGRDLVRPTPKNKSKHSSNK